MIKISNFLTHFTLAVQSRDSLGIRIFRIKSKVCLRQGNNQGVSDFQLKIQLKVGVTIGCRFNSVLISTLNLLKNRYSKTHRKNGSLSLSSGCSFFQSFLIPLFTLSRTSLFNNSKKLFLPEDCWKWKNNVQNRTSTNALFT